ncbi:Aldehyde/histidinol dehydrogenase [Phellopilus nigrolimitatus]|nr:Aldehyde/histidinol dehydrogenase [Phellopilus nigrolimitatus]
MAPLIAEAGFPPGVVSIVNGYGYDAGAAIAAHPHIEKVAYTGSTLVGRWIAEIASQTNLKNVTLELGRKSPNIIFDNADITQAVNWAAHGVFWNHGYIVSGLPEGATLQNGGERHGEKGYFIQPTIFTDTHLEIKIVREIFGQVGVEIKFSSEEDVIRQANDSQYGLEKHQPGAARRAQAARGRGMGERKGKSVYI